MITLNILKHDILREGKPANATTIGIYEILLESRDVSQHRRDDSRWFLITDTSCLDMYFQIVSTSKLEINKSKKTNGRNPKTGALGPGFSFSVWGYVLVNQPLVFQASRQ